MGSDPKGTIWRQTARNLHREGFLVLKKHSDYPMGIQESDLNPPWTPELLLNQYRMEKVLEHYRTISEDYPEASLRPWWIPEASGEDIPRAIFEQVTRSYREAGMTGMVIWTQTQMRKFERRVSLLHSDPKWVKFQVDINWPSLFLDVDGPDVWQVIVDAFQKEGDRDWRDFLKNMRMASLDYVQKEIPGAHDEKGRVHIPDMPLGYGVSTTIPSFGYRREHRSEILFVGWAASVMPWTNLFSSGWDNA